MRATSAFHRLRTSTVIGVAATTVVLGTGVASAQSIPEPLMLSEELEIGAAPAFSPDGRTLAVLERPYPQAPLRMSFWSLDTGKRWSVPLPSEVFPWEGAPAFSVDGNGFAAGVVGWRQQRPTVRFYSIRTARRIGPEFRVPAPSTFNLTLSRDGRWLFAGTGMEFRGRRRSGEEILAGGVYAWDLRRRRRSKVAGDTTGFAADDVATDHHGRRVAVAFRGGRWLVVDRRTRRILLRRVPDRRLDHRFSGVEIDASGNVVAAVRADGRVELARIGRRSTETIQGTVHRARGLSALALTSDGRRLAFSGPDTAHVTVWDVRARAVLARLPIEPCELKSCAVRLVWDSAGRRLAVVDGSPVKNGTRLRLFELADLLPSAARAAESLASTANVCVRGQGSIGSCGDGGPALSAKLAFPGSVAALPGGVLAVADTWNNRIRRVDASGIISTLAGDDRAGFAGDGARATRARLRAPADVTAAFDGSLLVADTGNHRVRRIDAAGRISTVAGTGAARSAGDGGAATAAGLEAPVAVSARPDGGFYIADGRRVRFVDAAGRITTVAGGAAQNPIHPVDVAWSPDGSVLIADSASNEIRRLLPSGAIATTVARVANPIRVASLPDGGMLVLGDVPALGVFSVGVTHVSATGVARVIAGGGLDQAPFVADATRAVLVHPSGLDVTSDGRVLVTETAFVERVRVITLGGGIAPVVGSSEPGDDFQGETKYDAVWNLFYLTGPRRQRAGPRLPITYISSRRARVRVSVIRSRRTVARAQMRARPGRARLVIRGRFSRGRYTVQLVGRAGDDVRRSTMRLHLR
jgi:sugar lactone lactonase YvrE